MLHRILGGLAGLAAIAACATKPKESETATLPSDRSEDERHAMARKMPFRSPTSSKAHSRGLALPSPRAQGGK